MAEIWFGTHSGSMTQVLSETQTPMGSLLDLRAGAPLDYLLKLLAAGTPLSIQAHPNAEQAKAGFARENALGIPLDSPVRNYRDDRHKPEMIVALTPFVALTGFRPLAESLALFKALAEKPELAETFAGYIDDLQLGVKGLVEALLHQRGQLGELTKAIAGVGETLTASSPAALVENREHLELASTLEGLYPGDPGIVISLLMNLVNLEPGLALQLGAGNIHAYVSGLGVELMASSDNVLRGGLTPKHIDVEELCSVLDFNVSNAVPIRAKELARGLYEFPRVVPDYLLYRVEVSSQNLLADLKIAKPSIFLCTEGEIAVSDSTEQRLVLRKGEAAYLADAKFFSFSGSGAGFLATS
jgi:mannose-6-phosphate isomerase